MFSKKILVIEDTELMQRLIRDILEKEGYEVYSAYSGEEGLDKVAEVKPDLVILDIVMPGMSGFDVCRALRANDSNILTLIIMLTSQVSEDDKLIGLEMGADDYIIKPFNSRELVSRVRNTLVRIYRNRGVNPLTGLCGNNEIQTELNHRLATHMQLAFIYCDLDNFKSYNDVYGFAQGDSVLRLTADIIRDSVRHEGNCDDFIGHIGGDDFIVITSWDKYEGICKHIIEDFDTKILFLYNETDRENKYIVSSDRNGQERKFPIISISLAVVTNEFNNYDNHLQIAEVAAEVKKFVKRLNGSNYMKDRRTN
jgi:diguanylate cyclase (GGDEF)-like protein